MSDTGIRLRPKISYWCLTCQRLGLRRGWDARSALVSPRGVAHHQADHIGSEMTACGHNAARDGWWWPL